MCCKGFHEGIPSSFNQSTSFMHLCYNSKKTIFNGIYINSTHFEHFRSFSTRAREHLQTYVIAATCADISFTQTGFFIPTAFTNNIMHCCRFVFGSADTLLVHKDRTPLTKQHDSFIMCYKNISGIHILLCAAFFHFDQSCQREMLFLSVKELRDV